MAERIVMVGRVLLLGLALAAGVLIAMVAAGNRDLALRRTTSVGDGAVQTPVAVPPSGTGDGQGTSTPPPTFAPDRLPSDSPTPTFAADPLPLDSPTPLPTPPAGKVGILAGHWQYDSGAVCNDGRQEVEVTTDVALRVQAILEYRGYQVDLLPEHDPDEPQPPLQGYSAAALVSIHADSCDVPGATGYKVARWRHSQMPAVEDRLVDCLYGAYARATLLAADDDGITDDMTNYYAFREIATETAAAIIEVGYLGGDRTFLDEHRYEIALGIANGIDCFLEPDRGE